MILDKVNNFYGSIQGGAEEAAKKIEKMLTVLKIDDATNAGKNSFLSLLRQLIPICELWTKFENLFSNMIFMIKFRFGFSC